MGGITVSYSLELNEDHMSWLQEMTAKYALDSESKALRIIIDYLQESDGLDTVFEEIRCNHCS